MMEARKINLTKNEMKTNMKPLNVLSSLVAVSVFGISSALAATTSSKDGTMQTTTNSSNSNELSNDGLPILDTGVQELGLSGKLNWEADTVYSFDVSYGRFFTPNWLLGIEGGLSGIDSEKDYRVGAFAEYNFLTNTKWVPFVRATAGYVHPSTGEDGGLLDLDAGIKYFMRSNLAISGSVGGGWNTNGDADFEKQVNLGLKFYFN
jgi:hypothetical protein